MSCWLYVVGSLIGLYFFFKVIFKCKLCYFIYGLVFGYVCVWVGYFVFEKNKLVSFKQFLYSFIFDWCMFFDVLCGNLSL